MNQLKQILVAVDFSAPSRGALERALALARSTGASVLAVHAVARDERFRLGGRARATLMRTLRRQAASAGVALEVSVQQGDAAGVILLHARASRPDLIVIGTHGRTGLDRLRAGSVAEQVTLGAGQPVLVVPDREAAPKPFSHVVVGVDFSVEADRAVEHALAIAMNPADRVTLVHVVPGSSAMAVPRRPYRNDVLEHSTRLGRDAWQRLQQAVPPQAKGRVRARVVFGHPPSEISRVASEAGADLIVVGVTRRGAISRLVFPSTAARVVRVASRPVLAVPGRAAIAAPPADRDAPAMAA